ncbi:uncharacterized protein [Pleurodeles waltl]
MKGYGMHRTEVKEPLHQWSGIYHQGGGSSTQVSGPHLSFLYPMPPYMCLRMIVRKELVFMPRARILMDMLKRFEMRDLVAGHTWFISSSRPVARNNIPVAHSPRWNQKVMVPSEKRMSFENAHKRRITHGYGGTERVGDPVDHNEASSRFARRSEFRHFYKYTATVIDNAGKQLCKEGSGIIAKVQNSNNDSVMANSGGATAAEELKFKHFGHYSARVTDKEKKELYVKGLKLMAKPISSNNKATIDIHYYSATGPVPEKFVADSKSPSILEKILEDAGSRSTFDKLLGDPESLSKLQESLSDSEPLDMAFASQPALQMVKSLKQLNKLAVTLSIRGTNLYLAAGKESPFTLEVKTSEDLAEISGSNIQFIFWQDLENGMKNFESGMHNDFFICTSAEAGTSPVELRTGPELQKAISEFLVSD